VKRFTIVNMMMLIGVVALGMAAMRSASWWTEAAVWTVLLAALFVGLLGAIVRRGDAAWVGFALFGWGYAALAFLPALRDEFQVRLPMNVLLDKVTDHLLALPPDPGFEPAVEIAGNFPMRPVGVVQPPGMPAGSVTSSLTGGMEFGGKLLLSESDEKRHQEFMAKVNTRISRLNALAFEIESARRIGHSILALTFGLIGAILGQFLASRQTLRGLSSSHEISDETSPQNSVGFRASDRAINATLE
jgi:hypothetical protein